MKKILVAASVAFALCACGNSDKGHAPAADSVQSAPADRTGTDATAQFFGEKINEDSVVSIAELKTLMGDKKEMKVKLMGEIESVCQKKGCWMELRNPNGESVHVTFKDYGFFMPKDAAGKTVIAEGVARVEETSVADLQEVAKDANKSKEEVAAIKTPKTELVFEASGVILK